MLRHFTVLILAIELFLSGAPGADWESLATSLQAERIPYGKLWRPPNQDKPWLMDCSNTVRWLYHEATGIKLPRTASAQYEYFRELGRLQRTRPDSQRLMRDLRRGDLLFWQHTNRPERNPPITHVMLYLGRDAHGRMWMTGAQGTRGVAIYEFHPEMKMGGYRWFLWFRRKGRFVAYTKT